MAVYLFTGKLPWQGLAEDSSLSSDVLYTKISQLKEEAVRSGDLFKSCPYAFKNYFNEVQKLEFAENPNYSHLR